MTDSTDKTQLELLKDKADRMGIEYHPNIGVTKLKAKVDEKLGGKTIQEGETKASRNARLRKEANKLVRVSISCMNPNKKNWPGEIISVGNSAIGTIKKFIPFEDAEDGYHIPVVILNELKERKYLAHKIKRVDGKKVKVKYQAKEFSIDELEPLTVEELKQLAAKQAMTGQE